MAIFSFLNKNCIIDVSNLRQFTTKLLTLSFINILVSCVKLRHLTALINIVIN